MNWHLEESRQIPVVDHVDVVVCGAGPAGISAALAAARAGARTRLIETHGCLGGVWTAGLLSWILDKDNKPGIMQEILWRLDQMNARRGNAYDPEAMKTLLEQMCLESGVEVRLHTRVVAASRDANNRLAVAITESKSGREAWAASVFVDCTGDGDLAAQAGCGFDFGQEETGEIQPMSLLGLLTGVDFEALHELGLVRGPNVSHRGAKDALRVEMQQAGIDPSYSDPTLFPIRHDLFTLMANHEYGAHSLDAQQLTNATIRARAEVNQMIEALRRKGGVWQNLRLVGTAAQIGVREGRRIHGRYKLTRDDLIHGRKHHDAVCRVTFNIDVHTTNPAKAGHKGIERISYRAQPYDIPYRAMIAKDVDGLLLAGRCISGDFIAHSSYRVTGNAVAMGQAAGIAAASATKQARLPHQLDWSTEVQPVLRRMIDACETPSPGNVRRLNDHAKVVDDDAASAVARGAGIDEAR